MSSGASSKKNRLKVVGLVLISMGLLGVAELGDRTDWQPWSEGIRSGQLPQRALIFLLAGNALALGVFALVAAFRHGKPLTRAARRATLLLTLLGANLVLAFSGLWGLSEVGVFGDMDARPWLLLPSVAVMAVMIRIGVLSMRRGWKYHALSASELLERDPRPPVVYIRSFADDDAVIAGSRLQRALTWLFGYMIAISPEQELAMILGRVGPVVAIGQPGESLPELGAARLYASDDEWRGVITDLMRRARLVVVRAGSTSNLQWEIDEALRLLPPQRLVLVSFAFGKEAAGEFDAELTRRFGTAPVTDWPPLNPVHRWIVRMLSAGVRATPLRWRVIYFDDDAKPHAVPVPFAISPTSVFSLGTRPYRDPLNAVFRLVLNRLGVPWIGRKTQTWAALLAVCLGAFGAHHLYLGDRRRALRYLAFCWTGVPIFFALRDAVRFTMLEPHEFQKKFVESARS